MKKDKENEFLALLEQNMYIIVKIARVYAFTKDDREELTSDIIFELWKSYPKFKGDSRFSTWLYRVALNIALKTKRKRDNHKLIFVREIAADANRFYDTQEENRSEINRLYQCIEQLTPINKAIILLYLDEKPSTEIAAITGISSTNVTTRLSRIREQLKQCMIKNDRNGN